MKKGLRGREALPQPFFRFFFSKKVGKGRSTRIEDLDFEKAMILPNRHVDN
jgi:hypothetical protein